MLVCRECCETYGDGAAVPESRLPGVCRSCCEALREALEGACAIAAQLYADGCDTLRADAEVDRLHALLHPAEVEHA